MSPCPLCGATTEAAVWPFLKGVGADGETLEWRRCNHCQALFSKHTLPPEGVRVIATNRGYPHNDYKPS